MRMKGFMATVVAGTAFLLVSSTQALADFEIVHNSQEAYFESGFGTDINPLTGCQVGCFDGCVGDCDGDFKWKINQQGFWDVAGDQTKITYTVGNVDYDDPIMSFHTPSFLEPVGVIEVPDDWSAVWMNGFIWWTTTVEAAGIDKFQDLNMFTATWDGVHVIGFDGPVTVDFDSGNVEISSDFWVVSTIPLPGAWLLGAIGLAGVGWLKRRFT